MKHHTDPLDPDEHYSECCERSDEAMKRGAVPVCTCDEVLQARYDDHIDRKLAERKERGL